MRHDVVLTEAPEAHEDSHVDCSPLHWDCRSRVKAGKKIANVCFLGHLGSRSLTWGGCRRSPCWPWSSPLRQYFNQHHKWWENLQIGIFKNAWIYKLFLIPGWGCWLTSGGGGISQQPTFQSAIKFSFRDSSWDIYDVHFIIMGQILLYTLVPFSGTLWTISLVFAGYLFKDRLWIGLESL